MHSQVQRIEPLEPRRLLTADLSFGGYVVAGSLFAPGTTPILKAYVRNFGNLNVTSQFNVQFKYVNVGFSAGADSVSFDDPNAVVLATAPVSTPIAIGSVGVQISFPLTFPADLPAGRYVLLAKLDSDNALMETREDNNVKNFGATRTLPVDGNLIVTGTDAADSITIATTTLNAAAAYKVTVGAYNEVFEATKVTAFSVNSLAGDDTIVGIGAIPALRIDAGDGNDKMLGGDLNDTLIGGAGKDVLDGGLGNDRLNGNGGNDRLFGNFGSDRLYGYAGNDYLDGGASGDRLEGGAGIDTILGQSGNDHFFTRDSEIDNVFGGSGNDDALADVNDTFGSVEIKLP